MLKNSDEREGEGDISAKSVCCASFVFWLLRINNYHTLRTIQLKLSWLALGIVLYTQNMVQSRHDYELVKILDNMIYIEFFFNKYQVRMVQDMSEAQDDNFKKVKTNKYLLFVIFQSLIFKTVVQSNYFLIVV